MQKMKALSIISNNRVYSNMNEEKELPSSYADDTSKENIQPQQVQRPTLSLQQNKN